MMGRKQIRRMGTRRKMAARSVGSMNIMGRTPVGDRTGRQIRARGYRRMALGGGAVAMMGNSRGSRTSSGRNGLTPHSSGGSMMY